MATGSDVGVVELVACVVGLSRTEGEDFTEHEGVGKSCLCYRFFYSNSDSDVNADDHKSLFALHEFSSPVINSTHFLYWGSQLQSYNTTKGSKSSSPSSAKVKFHVIEQTVFYRDETSKPFLSSSNPGSLEQYARRITGSIESPGKLSYKSCNDIESNSDKKEYPSRISSRVPRGFLVVLDVSLSGDEFEAQLKRAEHVLGHLMKQKQKYIVVATKRDNCNMDSLESAQKLKRKYHTQLIETSANRNINVHDAFRVLASKTLHKKLPGISDNVPAFEEAVLSEEVDPKVSMKPVSSTKHVGDVKRPSRSTEKVKGWRKSKLLFGKAESDNVVANDADHSPEDLLSVELEQPRLSTPDPGNDILPGQEVDIVALCQDSEGKKSLGHMTHHLGRSDESLGHMTHHLGRSDENILKRCGLEPPKTPPKSPLPGQHSEKDTSGSKPSFWKDWRSLKQVWRKSGVHSAESHEQEPLLYLD